MKYGNLKNFRCPKCGADLCKSIKKEGAYECTKCDFFINGYKFINITSNQFAGIKKEEHYRPADEVPNNY